MTKRVRRLIALGVCALPLALACGTKSSGGGEDAGVDGGDAGRDATAVMEAAVDTPDADSCLPHHPPIQAATSTSIALHGVNFGDHLSDGGVFPNAWMEIGYNLDGLCTHTTDTNVCTPPDNGNRVVQQDGVNGTDNTFGHVVLAPIKQLVSPTFFATSAVFVDITDGTGNVYVGGAQQGLLIPVVQASVSSSAGGGGTFSGIVPVAPFLEEVRATAGRVNGNLCTGMGITELLTQLHQSADIGVDGTQTPGVACTGISIGLTFTTSEASSPPSELPNPCSQ